jgi:hypothetical protein
MARSGRLYTYEYNPRQHVSRQADDRPDPSDLIGDIRAALRLPVTDCKECGTCIAEAEAIHAGGRTRCPECAEELERLEQERSPA